MQTGKINVQTENIFPIIKKFLYSDHEIFLRELISNAVDATQKLKALSSMGNIKEDLGDLTIEVIIDKDKGTLTVKDNGVGMTAEEVDKYINQIAFSGAEEFLKKYKGKSEADAAQLIGHFGLGFYSSFMVSKKVEIITKTYKKGPGSKAMKWECDGSPEYTLSETEKSVRGTEIVLHIADDSKEFLEEHRILDLLKKYCKFLPVPILFGNEKSWEKIEGEKDEKGNDKYDEIEKPRFINNINPAWKRKPADLTEEDYNSFYRELYPSLFESAACRFTGNVAREFILTGNPALSDSRPRSDPLIRRIHGPFEIMICHDPFRQIAPRSGNTDGKREGLGGGTGFSHFVGEMCNLNRLRTRLNEKGRNIGSSPLQCED